jgi:hypothetical protein
VKVKPGHASSPLARRSSPRAVSVASVVVIAHPSAPFLGCHTACSRRDHLLHDPANQEPSDQWFVWSVPAAEVGCRGRPTRNLHPWRRGGPSPSGSLRYLDGTWRIR